MEATVQTLTTSLPGEEPFIGDGAEGELITNTTDGRIWAADVTGNPIELGGACVNKPINTNLYSGNYLDIDVTNPDNLPIPVPDPISIPAGFCREIRILMRFVGNPLQTFSTYFDYDVNWGERATWPIPVSDDEGNYNLNANNPVDVYARNGSLILVELSAFGPSPSWMGRVIWADTYY